MKVYQVGGCVRDKLLGRTPNDIDYVVVGATPQEMLDLGFSQVGASFPVFLHPTTGAEYALARTERKTGVGYLGFETDYNPNVTLEDDLYRRDLTINSMAMDEDGNLIDPCGGQADLEACLLRHTSEAFAEDPVRVLRTARFAARFGFQIAPETLKLMGDIAHELDFVPQERIWAEIEKGLMGKYPADMFDCLKACKVFERCGALKPYRNYDSKRLWKVSAEHDLIVRFVLTCKGFMDEDYAVCRVPNDCAEVGRMFHKYFDDFLQYTSHSTSQSLKLLYEMRAFSGASMAFGKCMEVLKFFPDLAVQLSFMTDDYKNASSVNCASIAAAVIQNPATRVVGLEIKEAIFSARLAAL